MEVTKWLKPSDSVSRYTVTARVCRRNASERRANLEPQFSSVNPAKNNRSSRKDCVSVAQQEVKRGPQNGNGHIDLLVLIL
jgi:hypothetical protein